MNLQPIAFVKHLESMEEFPLHHHLDHLCLELVIERPIHSKRRGFSDK